MYKLVCSSSQMPLFREASFSITVAICYKDSEATVSITVYIIGIRQNDTL